MYIRYNCNQRSCQKCTFQVWLNASVTACKPVPFHKICLGTFVLCGSLQGLMLEGESVSYSSLCLYYNNINQCIIHEEESLLHTTQTASDIHISNWWNFLYIWCRSPTFFLELVCIFISDVVYKWTQQTCLTICSFVTLWNSPCPVQFLNTPLINSSTWDPYFNHSKMKPEEPNIIEHWYHLIFIRLTAIKERKNKDSKALKPHVIEGST